MQLFQTSAPSATHDKVFYVFNEVCKTCSDFSLFGWNFFFLSLYLEKDQSYEVAADKFYLEWSHNVSLLQQGE